jgi:hypothetical protein
MKISASDENQTAAMKLVASQLSSLSRHVCLVLYLVQALAVSDPIGSDVHMFLKLAVYVVEFRLCLPDASFMFNICIYTLSDQKYPDIPL